MLHMNSQLTAKLFLCIIYYVLNYMALKFTDSISIKGSI